MEALQVEKHVEISGRDDDEVDRRLATFCAAIRARGGVVLDIERPPAEDHRGPIASVVYEVPIPGSPV